ncbi:MAG: putative BlaI family transcriptional regulator [Amycolatopsis sp.]|jgi:predicted transcriptional regulator|uniref:BlaI/MecI/CopY family transcriptional regulator n=1 Tax=Amycolatopsis sp. TaxID=37632 RepID=UPI00260FC5F9|nr:BlaI/MecI/CopY family transcriptional regulator [Amycolatopsis sp.]MCU1686615.1 putative BlaI family transcriptional regulator [Amycolatopsis sp.]
MRVRGFGDLEAVIMDRLWDRDGKTTVRDVFEDLLQGRDIAYTTVMSTMDNLHRKGWLDRERHGKAFAYWPILNREQYSARLMRDALDAGGNSGAVLTHLVEQMTDEESATLRAALARLTSKGTR